jgi:hypothetical protein
LLALQVCRARKGSAAMQVPKVNGETKANVVLTVSSSPAHPAHRVRRGTGVTEASPVCPVLAENLVWSVHRVIAEKRASAVIAVRVARAA